MPFGALLQPSAEDTCLSGTLVLGNQKALLSLVGEAAFQRALASIPAERRERLVHGTALSWVPIRDMEYLLMACADEAQRDVFALNLEVTRLGTEQSFRTVWRVLLRFTTDSMILARTAAVYSRAYDRGELRVQVLSDGLAECEIRGRPGISRMTREAFGVGIETVLRVGGRGNAQVTSRSTPDGASYVIRRR